MISPVCILSGELVMLAEISADILCFCSLFLYKPVFRLIHCISRVFSSSFFCHLTWYSITTWPMTTNFGYNFSLVHHYLGYQAQIVTCYIEVTRSHWTLHVKKLRHGPIFTKFSNHMCFDQTKQKVNYKFFVSGQERSLEVKRSFSLKILLVLQIKTQNHQTWSVESLNLATYRMFRDKGQRSHKGH